MYLSAATLGVLNLLNYIQSVTVRNERVTIYHTVLSRNSLFELYIVLQLISSSLHVYICTSKAHKGNLNSRRRKFMNSCTF